MDLQLENRLKTRISTFNLNIGLRLKNRSKTQKSTFKSKIGIILKNIGIRLGNQPLTRTFAIDLKIGLQFEKGPST